MLSHTVDSLSDQKAIENFVTHYICEGDDGIPSMNLENCQDLGRWAHSYDS